MGFAASQARLLGLISRRSDLEFEAQVISQHRMALGNNVSGLFNLQAKLEPDSEASKQLEGRIKQLQETDKLLEMHLNRINSQREAVSKEEDSTHQIITDDIKRSFGIVGGNGQ